MKRLETAEASALGAAMAAAKGAGWFKTDRRGLSRHVGQALQDLPSTDERSAARYQELLAIYTDLWPKLSDWNQKLVAFRASET